MAYEDLKTYFRMVKTIIVKKIVVAATLSCFVKFSSGHK